MSKYDVFISFKNTDTDGEKTQDYFMANDLYNALTGKGIKVFFSPVSLKQNAVSNYSKYIDSAIEESDILIAVSTSTENFNSKWVDYEIGTFSNELKNGNKDEKRSGMISFITGSVNVNKLPVCLRSREAYTDLEDVVEWVLNWKKTHDILDAGSDDKKADMIIDSPSISAPFENGTRNVENAEEPVADNAGDAAAQIADTAGKANAISEMLDEIDKKNKNNRRQAKTPSGRKRTPLLVFCAVIACVAAIVAFIIIRINANTVVIAGEKFLKSETSVTLKEKTLTENDIGKLPKFKQLSSLRLTDCTLPDSDISTLFTATGFYLEIANCGLTDKQISSVDFSNVSLSDLVLDGNKTLTDLSALRPLCNTLTYLSFDNCSVSDVSFLSDFKEIKFINMAGNGITSLQALSGCTKLEELSAGENSLTDLTGLEKCIRLERIYASHNKINSLDGLKNTTLLTDVDLSYNEISDISVLSKSKSHLKTVELTKNMITDIGPLSGAVSLEELVIMINSITDISSVSSLTGLTRFTADMNSITDITALSACKKLSYVSLSFNKIEKVDALVLDDSAARAVLNISYNNVTSLDIPAVDYLTLSVYGNPISDFSGLYNAKVWYLSIYYSDAIDFESLGKVNYGSCLIFHCPLDKQVEVENALGSSRVTFSNINEE